MRAGRMNTDWYNPYALARALGYGRPVDEFHRCRSIWCQWCNPVGPR